MITGSLLGFFGIFLEGLSFFAVYRLMADAAPKYAHLYRAGIFVYIWLAADRSQPDIDEGARRAVTAALRKNGTGHRPPYAYCGSGG